MKLRRLAILSLGLMLTACASLGTFHDADVNQDGRVTREEAARSSADLADLFDGADGDRDGALNEEEYEMARRVILQMRGSPPAQSPGHDSGGGHKH